MPNPTRARAAQYLVDPFTPTRDTLPCEHCGTTLSNCDWFSDHLGRLSPRCPNAHRHGTGWRAHPEPAEVPPFPTHCEDCFEPIAQNRMGCYVYRCRPCAAKRDKAQKSKWRAENRERALAQDREAKARARARQQSMAERLRAYWQTKDVGAA